jgi:hypothetical protein
MGDYIETPLKQPKHKHNKRKIEVIDGVEATKMQAKKQFKATKKLHNKAIRSIIWQAIKDCHKHKLLKKQAKIVYKLSK